MSKTILLDTRTSTFLELIGNGRRYEVPPYQRDYAWEAEQWEDLWNDILELRGDASEKHYMGALVVEAKTDRDLVIIDGQQRIATLSIVALVIIGRLSKLAATGVDDQANRDRAAALRSRFIGERDPASLIEASKLRLNQTDDPFYQDYLVQLRTPLNARGLPRSCQRLWECFAWFTDRVESIPELRDDGQALAFLLNETIARQLLFILISVDDDLNAYTVFETLNARGIELSATDLLKNFLFSKVRVGNDLASLQRRWKRMVDDVRQERFPDFLRYHLLCELPSIRSQRLFKVVRSRIKTPVEVFALLDVLEPRAQLFAALSDPQHDLWLDVPKARPFLQELAIFRAKQMTPLLFAAWEALSKDHFVGVLRLVSTITFRHTVVGRRNPNELEAAYHQAAKSVLFGAATTAEQVFQQLRGVYVGDAEFEADFTRLELRTGGQGKRLAKYTLCRLETQMSGKDCDFETDPATLEHVLPENPGAVWDDNFPSNRQSDFTYRVGNLSLLEATFNRAVSNLPFAQKVAVYAKSRYELTRAFATAGPDEWTPAAVEHRQAQLAKLALQIWRVDYRTN